MSIPNFISESLPVFYIYIAIAFPTVAVTLFVAWFIAAILPLLPKFFDHSRHRFRSYLKDVDFRRAFLSRRVFDQKVRGGWKWITRPIWEVRIWVSSWKTRPPPGLSELDSVPVERVEEGMYRSVQR